MAYALVGAIGTVASNAGATVSPTYAQSTSAGNLLIAWVLTKAGSQPTTPATGWTITTAGSGATIFYRANSTAGETAPVFSSASATLMRAVLAEFSGGATSSPLDQIGVGTGATSPVVAANAAADVTLGELFVSCASPLSSKAETITTSDTYNNGATPTSNLNNDATSTADHYRFAWGITTSKAAADQTSFANGSMNISSQTVRVASFLLASTVRPTFANPTNFMDPGIF